MLLAQEKKKTISPSVIDVSQWCMMIVPFHRMYVVHKPINNAY